jgi:alpha-tubulin suppressor-like RCC1 family protein
MYFGHSPITKTNGEGVSLELEAPGHVRKVTWLPPIVSGTGDKNRKRLRRRVDVVELPEHFWAINISYTENVALALGMDGSLLSWWLHDGGDEEDFDEFAVVLGRNVDSKEAARVPGVVTGDLEGKYVVNMSAGLDHCTAVTRDGRVYAWGYHGHIRNDEDYNDECGSTEPRLVKELLKVFITHTNAGRAHAQFFSKCGSSFSCGYNYDNNKQNFNVLPVL